MVSLVFMPLSSRAKHIPDFSLPLDTGIDCTPTPRESVQYFGIASCISS